MPPLAETTPRPCGTTDPDAPAGAAAAPRLGRYGLLLRQPGVAPTFLASVVGKLPSGIVLLGIVLFVARATGSYALAGAVLAGHSAGAALAAPVVGRWIDRRGQRRPLLLLAVAYAASLGALVAAGSAPGPPLVLVALGTLVGGTFPPLPPAMRALWPSLLGARTATLLPTALALEAAATDVVFVAGPLLAAGLVTLVAPAAALLLAAALAIGGTLAFTAQPASRARTGAPDVARAGMLGVLRTRGLRTTVACGAAIGFCLGATEVALPVYARDAGHDGAAGILIAVWAGGSVLGGVAYGIRRWAGPAHRRWPPLLLAFGLLFLPLAAAPSLPLIVPTAVLAGVLMAPVLAAGNEVAGTLAAPGTETETYSWAAMATTAGSGIGAALAGQVAEGLSWRLAVLAAALVALAAAALAAARRERLAPSHEAAPVVATALGEPVTLPRSPRP